MNTATLDAEQVTAESIAADAAPRLKADGTVRQKPGPKPGTVRKPRTAPAPGKAPAAKKAAAGTVDYRPAIIGLAQLPALGLGLAGRFLKRPALELDAMTLGIHAPTMAEALNETAKNEQRLADVLDKLLQVGPYGAVIAAAMPIAMQILVNHGKAAANEQVGTFTPERLVEIGAAAAGVK